MSRRLPRYSFTRHSRNAKTGPIPVTYSPRSTCPEACPYNKKSGGKGCYAEAGFFTRLHWDHLDAGTKGMSWKELCDNVRALPPGTLWRHNIAGDLPGKGDIIDRVKLQQLTSANKGKRGFTYTHKPYALLNVVVGHNADCFVEAVLNGFAVNISCDTISEAECIVRAGQGQNVPAVVVLPHDVTENFKTPNGTQVVICPATQRDDVTCATCGLCADRNRTCIIGFPAHGRDTKDVDKILWAKQAQVELSK